MASLFSRLIQVLLWPFHFLVMIIASLMEDADLANWAARRLGLQGDAQASGFKGSGLDALVGSTGQVKLMFTVTDEGTSQGKVLVRGELWNATAPLGPSIPQVGETVRIVAVEGLTLIVEPTSSV